MKLTVLTENHAGGRLLAEHGLSYLVEFNGTRSLFDAGHSDVFLKNAASLGIDVERGIQMVVLSHGHWDHGDGLQYLYDKTLITHPSSFMKRYHRNSGLNLGLALSREDLEKRFHLITTAEPYELTSNLYFLGSIPRTNDFESKSTAFVDENGDPDFVPDDSALAGVEDDQLIVITGCSHSGICNIVEHAKRVTGADKIKAVVGGFHLQHFDEQTMQTVRYFKEQKIDKIYPSHCTGLPALTAFHNAFEIRQLKTGMVLSF